jgi:hypothetical protein
MNQSHAATTIPTDHVSAYRPADTDWFRQALALTAAWPTSAEAGGIDRAHYRPGGRAVPAAIGTRLSRV